MITELEALTLEHPYREPLWGQLITAYYLTDRQVDALDAYRRLQKTLADDLGIDPGPNMRALNEKILRQEPLDAKVAARTTAAGTVTVPRPAHRRCRAGRGRLSARSGRAQSTRCSQRRPGSGGCTDNEIVLDDANVSRHHAVIIDTGSNFIINDLRSSNGVHVQHQRIRSTATLNDGDHIRICDHEFSFEVKPPAGT